MAGMDSTFSAAGSNMSIGVVGKEINYGHADRGNPLGDRVDNTNGQNTLIENGFNGMYQQSAKVSGSIQYNPNSFYPNS
jgi:hypothetical protein